MTFFILVSTLLVLASFIFLPFVRLLVFDDMKRFFTYIFFASAVLDLLSCFGVLQYNKMVLGSCAYTNRSGQAGPVSCLLSGIALTGRFF